MQDVPLSTHYLQGRVPASVIIGWICLNRDPSSIYIAGNTAVDVLRKTIRSDYTHPYLEWANTSRLIILMSTCRDEMKSTLKNVVRAIKRIVNDEPEVKVIFPLHTDTDE